MVPASAFSDFILSFAKMVGSALNLEHKSHGAHRTRRPHKLLRTADLVYARCPEGDGSNSIVWWTLSSVCRLRQLNARSTKFAKLRIKYKVRFAKREKLGSA